MHNQLEAQEVCSAHPSEIYCEDEIPNIRRRLKEKLVDKASQYSFGTGAATDKNIEPIYEPIDASTQPCAPCPNEPQESVSTDIVDCHYEYGNDDDAEGNGVNLETSNENSQNKYLRPKRKIEYETKCREFTPSCGGTDKVNFQVIECVTIYIVICNRN